MRSKILICLVFVLALSSGMALAAGEKEWPTKPIELYVGYPPGGPSDTAARIYGPIMSKELGVPVVIMNKPGAGGALALEFITKQKPDGYSIMEVSFGQISQQPHTHHVSFTIDDFTYILSHSNYPWCILVKKDAPWKDFRELIEFSRKNRALSYGLGGAYNTAHIIIEWIARREKAKFSFVPFKGMGTARPALLGGHIDFLGSSGGHAPLIEGGKLRTLLQFSGEVADATKVPFLTELYPDFPPNLKAHEMTKGLAGPKGIPDPIVEKLANALRKATKSDEFIRFAKQGKYRIVLWDSAEIYKSVKTNFEATKGILKTMGFKKAQ